jgi:gluconate 2-dehydrogenase gamma chain
MSAKAPLTVAQLRLLDAVLERLIPGDAIEPGAREARVRDYVVRALASDYASHRAAYQRGLVGIDRHAQASFGCGFSLLPVWEQDAVLREIEQASSVFDPASLSSFFTLLRQHAIEGMFCDPAWGGNHDRVGWELLGYPGPRSVWSEAAQQIETIERPASG